MGALQVRRSPARGLCCLGGDVAVLVDGHHEALFGPPAPEPAQSEVEPMPTDYHGLRTASRFDAEALCCALSEVGVESG